MTQAGPVIRCPKDAAIRLIVEGGIRSHGIGRSFIGDDGRNSSLVALSPRFPAELQADRNEGSIIRIALGVIVHPQLDRE